MTNPVNEIEIIQETILKSPMFRNPITAALNTTTTSSEACSSSDEDNSTISPTPSFHLNLIKTINLHNHPLKPLSGYHSDFSYKPLSVLSGHVASVSSLALCGEFLLSASQGKDIIVWKQQDFTQLARFGQGDGSVKAMLAVESKVFTAHQDSRIRVWKVSRKSENVFKFVDSLPTKRDCLTKFMKQSNYVQTRRHHKKLWIEHSDSISCLTFYDGLLYSGSWDKTIKVWRLSDLKCLESINAHDDAINGLIACKGLIYSASTDGKIKAWCQDQGKSNSSKSSSKTKSLHSLKGILDGRDKVPMNSVIASEDGKWVYGGASNGYLLGWEGIRSDVDDEFVNWRVVSERKGHEMAVLCMCLIGEEFVCSGSADKSIVIWKREAGGKVCKIGVINGHEGPVKCLQGLPCKNAGDGFLLYSGGHDKSLRVWSIYENQQQNSEEEKNL